MTDLYGDRIREKAATSRVGRVAVRRMLQEWTGTKIGSSKARRVWDLVRHTVPDRAEVKSEVTQTDKGPLDKVIQSQGVKIKTLDELLAFCEVDQNVWRVKSY